jgi:hypothetical protein
MNDEAGDNLRRKALKNTAFTLCQIFSGWELINSYEQIKRIGSGVYKYDFINDSSTLDDKCSEKLNIYYALESFFTEEIKRMKIERSDFSKVEIEITINLSLTDSKEVISTETFYEKSGKQIKANKINKIDLVCSSLVETDEATYSAKLENSVGWPEGWLSSEHFT